MKWITSDTKKFLAEGYLEEGTTPEERIKNICDKAEEIGGQEGFSERFYEYCSQGWVSFSSPVWSNFGLSRGLPISCFASTTEDSTSDLLWGLGETGMLTKIGGGTGRDFRNIRPRGAKISSGGESNGSISFMEMYDTMMSVISQGNIRRGSLAVFLPIDHGDIKEFLEIKSTGSSIQNLSFGVSVPKGWMQEMIDGDTQKRKLWAKVLESRSEKGYPYIFFEDNVEKGRPQVYKDKDMDILHSNLCQEILEYTDSEKSFTCCLSSVNLLHYFEWKDTNFIKDMMYFLDCVLEDFIQRVEGMPFMDKVLKFAKEHRSVGLGVLGWHSLLQSKMIPFEGLESKMLNAEIFRYINEQSLEASKELAIEKGEPEILKGYGERFSTRIAIAPTTSSSFILGAVSPSIEPLASNYYIKGLAKGKFTYKNPILKDLLKTKDKDLPEVWDSILMKGGSVQHLGFLTQSEKNVFKTFSEVSQLEVIQQAAQRQQFIDQGQSLNLMISSNTSVKEINALLIEAWKLGIKTLYYQRSTNAAQEVARSLMECVSCEA
mgnify:FL=1